MRELLAESRPALVRTAFRVWSLVTALWFASVAAGFGVLDAVAAASLVFGSAPVSFAVATLLPELVPITIRPLCKSR